MSVLLFNMCLYVLNFTNKKQLGTPIQKYLKILVPHKASEPLEGIGYLKWVHLILFTF